jgi:transposase
MPLPPYAPELNSVENIWDYLRSNFLSHCVWDTYEAILDACCDAWNALMAELCGKLGDGVKKAA